ncbi:hypothetical protein JCM8097_003594 [Rhodosporidiobolus ruineniae]
MSTAKSSLPSTLSCTYTLLSATNAASSTSSSTVSPSIPIEDIPHLLPPSTIKHFLKPYYAANWGVEPGCIPRWTLWLETWYQAYCPDIWPVLEADDLADETAILQIDVEIRNSTGREGGAIQAERLEAERTSLFERQVERHRRLYLLHAVRQRFLRYHNVDDPRSIPWRLETANAVRQKMWCTFRAHSVWPQLRCESAYPWLNPRRPLLYVVLPTIDFDRYCLPEVFPDDLEPDPVSERQEERGELPFYSTKADGRRSHALPCSPPRYSPIEATPVRAVRHRTSLPLDSNPTTPHTDFAPYSPPSERYGSRSPSPSSASLPFSPASSASSAPTTSSDPSPSSYPSTPTTATVEPLPRQSKIGSFFSRWLGRNESTSRTTGSG